jgi:tetratricopeptide (TPR) repeat protein
MDRQHRRDLRHDKFVDEIGSLSLKARENQRFLTMITAGLVALAVLAYGIYFYRNTREQKAQQALGAAIETIDSPLAAGPGQQPVPNAKFKTEAEKNTAAEKQFQSVKSEYSGSDAADVADLYLARLAAGRGDVAGARKLLESFVNAHSKSLLVGSARYSLYQLRIENGEAAQVATEIDAEMKKDNGVLPGDTLLNLLAQAYDAQGNSVKSLESYHKLVTDFPDSPYALEAQRRVGPTTAS